LTLKRRCWALYRSRSRQQAARRARSDPRNPAEELISDPRPQPEERREHSERIAKARAQLARLKPQERRALGLLGLGYSYREICALTGWSYTKVNRCITEGRAALRESAANNEDLSPR
jgi:DNA-directed RNA polymerase specialized sigma24 family protein